MLYRITQFQADELAHKLRVLLETDDLVEELWPDQIADMQTALRSAEIYNKGSIWIADSIRYVVCEELEDHLKMLRAIPNHEHPQSAIRSIESLLAKLREAVPQ